MRRLVREKGVALVSALVVVALATTAAASLTTSQQLGLRRAENLMSRDQAYQYLVAAETWVGILLKRDAEETETDHLDEAWAQDMPPLPVDGGSLSGKLTDLTGLLNVNEILTEEDKVSSEHQERFRRLLEALELNTALLDPLIDWMDANTDPNSGNGAEDNYYLSLEKPYRPSNRAFVSPSELLLLRDFTAESYEKLRPFVTTLSEPVLVNVNTAPLEVLMALGLEQADAESIIETRPFEKIEDFTTLESVKKAEIKAEDVAITSNYFLLEAKTQIGRSTIKQFSILRREKGKITVVSRSLGTQ